MPVSRAREGLWAKGSVSGGGDDPSVSGGDDARSFGFKSLRKGAASGRFVKLSSQGNTHQYSSYGGYQSGSTTKKIDIPNGWDPLLDESVMEKILQRKSLRMCNFQRSWQESPEGVKMVEFRKSLPTYKEKERLLAAIAHNQVIVISGETGWKNNTVASICVGVRDRIWLRGLL